MRLIDANKLLKNGIRVSYGFDNDGILLIPMADIVKSIKQAPTIDAVPVRHGRWIYHPDDLFPGDSTQECSCCHEEEYLTLYNENYCPNCGAKWTEVLTDG